MSKRTIAAAGIYACLFFFIYLLTEREMSGTDLMLRLSFGYVPNHKSYFGEAFFQYLIILFAHVVFGTRLSENFCHATAYFYVRTASLRNWYRREIGKLFLETAGYFVIVVTVLLGLCGAMGKLSGFGWADLFFAGYFVLVYSLFTFLTAVMINLLSLYVESGVAFGITEGMNMLLIGGYLITGDVYTETELIMHPAVFRLNPICHLMIGIHKSGRTDMNRYLGNPLIQMNLSASVLCMTVVAVVVVIFGNVLIDRIDILGDKMEGD